MLSAKSILGTEFQTVFVRRDHIIIVLAHAICVRKRRKKKYDVVLENGLASPFLHKPFLPLKDDSAPAMCRGHTAVNRTARKPDT